MRKLLAGAVWLGVLGGVAPTGAHAQDRSDENAVTEADDAFGIDLGRESLGIYTSGNTRGFSPTKAGNVRIEGLYFDPDYSLTSIIAESVSIKVGLSAQGYPFAAPSGIVDYSLRHPGQKAGQSVFVDADSFGSINLEVDGTQPLTGTLSLGYGASAGHTEYSGGTNSEHHAEALIASWKPSANVEILPFWTLSNDYDDEAGPYYIPAGDYLPPEPPARQFDGPQWADFRYTATNHGVIATVKPARNWTIRAGGFRSVYDSLSSYTNLLYDVTPDGAAHQLVIADPRQKSVSASGEVRVTRRFTEGPRLHRINVSIRGRDATREYGGFDYVDLGARRIGEAVTDPRPDFSFSDVTRDRIRQVGYGVAYEGRWRGVGELSFGVSKVDYRKTTSIPGDAPIVSRSQPWIYNGTAAAYISNDIAIYAGYSRGLEESGVAPPNAANRSQPLPAIITEQKDAGFRWNVNGHLKLIAGVFDLRRPYFGYATSGDYTRIGMTRSRGAEVSLTGSLTRRLRLVAGGVFLKPRVEQDPTATGDIGVRPVGLPDHLINLNVDWRTTFLDGLSIDGAFVHKGKMPATTDNALYVPERATANVGGRYRFKLAKQTAVLRVQLVNLFDNRGFAIAGPDVFAPNAGRYLSGYLAIDF
ncbi:TonB-dependent receptor [Stakelama marina]|uniref:TonB-dependent receptor n=1 Tax=Stakelama marina TaxID=2826939 RepID=A0A8T4IHL6_9SPHN|nr:TonB-dependent receptor [Stakelama marina]MBR0553374.1 TonB-dependent receptor [Stakelama marina]